MRLLIAAVLVLIFGGLSALGWGLREGFWRWFVVALGAHPVLQVCAWPGERFAASHVVPQEIGVLLVYGVAPLAAIGALLWPGGRLARAAGLACGAAAGFVVGLVALSVSGFVGWGGFRLG